MNKKIFIYFISSLLVFYSCVKSEQGAHKNEPTFTKNNLPINSIATVNEQELELASEDEIVNNSAYFIVYENNQTLLNKSHFQFFAFNNSNSVKLSFNKIIAIAKCEDSRIGEFVYKNSDEADTFASQDWKCPLEPTTILEHLNKIHLNKTFSSHFIKDSELKKINEPIVYTIEKKLKKQQKNQFKIPLPYKNAEIYVGSTAGNGANNGVGLNARFNNPSFLTINSSGIIFISDTDSSTIRKVTLLENGDYDVTTIAGSPLQEGYIDDIGDSARFNHPNGIAVDNQGNIYVADTANNVIRKLSLSANKNYYQVKTIAGKLAGHEDGVGSSARFNQPFAIAIANNGVIYVSELGENKFIRKLTPPHSDDSIFYNVETLVFKENNIFSSPKSLVLDSSQENLLIADTKDIKTISLSNLNVSTLTLDEDCKKINCLNFPTGISRLNTNNNDVFYVFDSFTGSISQLSKKDNYYASRVVAASIVERKFTDDNKIYINEKESTGIAVGKNNELFVLDSNKSTLIKLTQNQSETTTTLQSKIIAGSPRNFGYREHDASDASSNTALFYSLKGIAIDKDDNLYVADSLNQCIRRIDNSEEKHTTQIAGVCGNLISLRESVLEKTSPPFWQPAGLSLIGDNLFVSDVGFNAIKKIDLSNSTPEVSLVYNPSKNYAIPTFNDLFAIDAKKIFITDTKDSAVYVAILTDNNEWKLNNIVNAGNFASSTVKNIDTILFNPFGIVVDSKGNIFISDSYHSTIKKLSLDGENTYSIKSIAGNARKTGFNDGKGEDSLFCKPQGMAIDSKDNIYVADTCNSRIRKIIPIKSNNQNSFEVVTLSASNLEESVEIFEPQYLTLSNNEKFLYVTSNDGVVKITLN